VVSTGSTLRGLRKLMAEADATIAGEMAVFTEGEEDTWPQIISLGNLPIFAD
jgi:adenine phosphoribosyltransferase